VHRNGSADLKESTRRYLAYAIIAFLFSILVPRIDLWGHAGGFFVGMALSTLLTDPEFIEKKKLWRGACIISLIFFFLVLGAYLPFLAPELRKSAMKTANYCNAVINGKD